MRNLQDIEPVVHELLQDALHLGLLLELNDGYAFAHDRIQEAAYAMLAPHERAAAHLLIGRLLLEAADERELDAQIFDIVTHFNKATTLAASPEEREANARLNLRAGRKARASAAYGAACDYLAFGRAQLGEDVWRRHHDLWFELELELAECTFLRGHLAETREMVHRLLSAANKTIEVAAAYLLATVESALDHDRAARDVAVTLAGVRARYDSLTARERDVFALVVSGLLNKQAAARLGISVVTLQIHRGNVMRKMAARSLADLVRMAMALEIPIEEAGSPRSVRKAGCEEPRTESSFSAGGSAAAPGWRRAAPAHRRAS